MRDENGQFLPGNISWNKEKKGLWSHSLETKKKMSMTHGSGKEHRSWKGDKISYAALHQWIKKMLGKIKECVYCGSEGRLEWANIDGKYQRNLDDYIPLCVPCHRKYDNWSEKMWKTRGKLSQERGYHGRFIKKAGDIHDQKTKNTKKGEE